jgi:HEAT repeat protein
MTWRDLAVAGHDGDEATARASLHDPDPVARELSLGALSRMDALLDDDLVEALRDPSPAVRRRAVLLAARRPDVSVLGAFDDPDETVVEAAAWTSGEQQPLRPAVDEAVLMRLIALATGSHDALVREAAVAALGAIGDERGLPAVLAGCVDKPAVRRRAVLALAPFDGPEVTAALQAALQDRDWQVRQSAEDVTPFMEPDERD